MLKASQLMQNSSKGLLLRGLVSLFILLFNSTVALGKTNYLDTTSWPKMEIKSIKISEAKGDSLQVQVAFSLTAIGKTPMALSQDQFTLLVFNTNFVSRGELSFTNAPAIFLTQPGSTSTLTADISMPNLSSGKYQAKILINSGKSQEFDYQWLGQMPSDEMDLTLPPKKR